MILKIQFCDPHEIDHLYCDSLSLVKLSCNHTNLVKNVAIIYSSLLLLLLRREMVFLGFGKIPKLQLFVFLIFLIIYVSTMAVNFLIILHKVIAEQLHILKKIPCLEILYSSTLLSKILPTFLKGNKIIYLK
ncbi:Olfactory receptor 10K2, partial [Ophiophagus hannah]